MRRQEIALIISAVKNDIALSKNKVEIKKLLKKKPLKTINTINKGLVR